MEEIKFGNWRIADRYVEWTNDERGWYEFPVSDFGRPGVGNRDGVIGILIHIPQKSWVTREDTEQLNAAAQYAIKEMGVVVAPGISWDNTMIMQEQWLTRRGI